MANKWIKKLSRALLPNPLDALCQRAKKENKRSFCIAWNRGLGDIPLLLYGMVERIFTLVPDASITFVTRKSLQQGFYLLDKVQVIPILDWERNQPYNLCESLIKIGKDPKEFDLLIENPDPAYWVGWQIGQVIPRLKWKNRWQGLWKNFQDLKSDEKYVGVQVATETGYNTFRDWPKNYWDELFSFYEKKQQKVLLFGVQKNDLFSHRNLIDLRTKTTPLDFLSIVKNCCQTLILPDSALLALTYYLDDSFPIDIFSLFADPTLGILRQDVPSPNPLLFHQPLIAKEKNLHLLTPEFLIDQLKKRPRWTVC